MKTQQHEMQMGRLLLKRIFPKRQTIVMVPAEVLTAVGVVLVAMLLGQLGQALLMLVV